MEDNSADEIMSIDYSEELTINEEILSIEDENLIQADDNEVLSAEDNNEVIVATNNNSEVLSASNKNEEVISTTNYTKVLGSEPQSDVPIGLSKVTHSSNLKLENSMSLEDMITKTPISHITKKSRIRLHPLNLTTLTVF